MCCSSQTFSANTGMVKLTMPNPNRDGTGPLGTVLSGASNGTYVKKITIKAQDATSQGMIRLFIDNGGSTLLFKEIYVPAVTPTQFEPAFAVTLFGGFCLSSTDVLKASTEQGQYFFITVDAVNWTNCSCPG